MKLVLVALVCLSVFVDARPQNERQRGTNSISFTEKSDRTSKAPVLAENEQRVSENLKKKKMQEEAALLFKHQAENAKYSFDSSIEDGIMGHAHSRSEIRDGLNVKGMYSYNDGFFKRTVHYEADDKGYRIVKEENEPIGDGPVIDFGGEARVRSSLGTEYRITVDDYQKKTPVEAIPRHEE